MTVIAMTREMGSLGKDVALKLADQLGLKLVNCTLHARYAAPREDILAVIRAFREIEKPFVMHCKSGADRAGFASALYLHVIEGQPLAEARRRPRVLPRTDRSGCPAQR